MGAQLGREDLLEGGRPADGRLGLRSRTAAGLAELLPGALLVEVLQVADAEGLDHAAGGTLDLADGVGK